MNTNAYPPLSSISSRPPRVPAAAHQPSHKQLLTIDSSETSQVLEEMRALSDQEDLGFSTTTTAGGAAAAWTGRPQRPRGMCVCL